MIGPTKIYLAGGMRTDWQDRVIQASTRGDDEIYFDPRKTGLKKEKDYTNWDLGKIKECHVIFAYLESSNPSGHGMAFECGYGYSLGKVLLFVNENSKFDRYVGMIRCCSTFYFDSFEKSLSFWRVFSYKNMIRVTPTFLRKFGSIDIGDENADYKGIF